MASALLRSTCQAIVRQDSKIIEKLPPPPTMIDNEDACVLLFAHVAKEMISGGSGKFQVAWNLAKEDETKLKWLKLAMGPYLGQRKKRKSDEMADVEVVVTV